MEILIAEDNAEKYGDIVTTLIANGISRANITHKVNAADAAEVLKLKRFDLLLLDINMPRRLDEAAVRGGGLYILKELERDETYIKPTYIVGITQFSTAIDDFREEFDERLWSLILYSATSDHWKALLGKKIDYIKAALDSRNFSDGETYGVDLAVICALRDVELNALLKTDCNWQKMNLSHDETRYYSGTIKRDNEVFSIIAASPELMGMPNSSVLSSKIIHQFRPRFLAMTGICAGRHKKAKIGDVVVAKTTWDWGSGKISTNHKKEAVFLPSPDHLSMDVDLVSIFDDISNDEATLANIRKSTSGKRTETELSLHVAPMVSGASVVANKETFDGLLNQHRDIHGLEMEAYGVAAAARGSAKPRPKWMVLKGVCDYADAKKHDGYQEFSAEASARILIYAANKFL